MNNSPVSAAKSASAFWNCVRERGGLMTAARARGKRNYDADLEAHVLKALGVSAPHITQRLLEVKKITLEQLVEAVFSSLEPWALLMSEVFEMFAEAGVQHGGDGIKIEIQLDELSIGLQTTLASFKHENRVTQSVMLASRGKSWGDIDTTAIWSICRKFQMQMRREDRESSTPIGSWAVSCRDWPRSIPGGRVTPPPLSTTGDDQFDALAKDVLALLKSFMRAARALGPTVDDRWKILSRAKAESDPVLNDGWVSKKVAMLDTDFVMVSIYEIFEHMALTREFDNQHGREALQALGSMVDGLPIGLSSEDQAERLLSLLDLPSWKARHELYAVWTASQVIKASPWPPKWNVIEGTLNFDFGGAEIARFEPEKSVFILRSELRRNLVGKSAGKRRIGIQPDFTLLNGSDEKTSPGHLVVECKQYRASNKSNFRAALTDYSRSHPDADVLLSNYGPVLASVSEGLGCTLRLVQGYGETYPSGRGLANFVIALRSSFRRAEQIVAREKASAERNQKNEEINDLRVRLNANKTDAQRQCNIHSLANISLIWDDGGDLDLHVVLQGTSGRYEVNFNDRGRSDGQPFAVLDQDVMSGP
ncbi:MAG: hypothetical protein V7727_19405, partial [Sneathiella sp.]